jgi:hypothetical protein
MNHVPHQILHLVFHLPADLAAPAAAEWALVEVARRHAPDLAPLVFGEAVGRLAPHYVGLVVRPAAATSDLVGSTPGTPAAENRPLAG